MTYPVGRNFAGRKVGSKTYPKEMLVFSNCNAGGRSKDDPPDVGVIFEGSGEKDIRFCTLKGKDVIKP